MINLAYTVLAGDGKVNETAKKITLVSISGWQVFSAAWLALVTLDKDKSQKSTEFLVLKSVPLL